MYHVSGRLWPKSQAFYWSVVLYRRYEIGAHPDRHECAACPAGRFPTALAARARARGLWPSDARASGAGKARGAARRARPSRRAPSRPVVLESVGSLALNVCRTTRCVVTISGGPPRRAAPLLLAAQRAALASQWPRTWQPACAMGAARQLARLLCLGSAARAFAGQTNVAGLMDVSWTTDLAAGRATFSVQALQPAGCVPRGVGASAALLCARPSWLHPASASPASACR